MVKRKGARLGQHFLTHSWAARTLAFAAQPREGETILEIGPGKGVLTKELLTLGPVVAIEKDEKLVEKLRETFADEIRSGGLKIISGDVRDFNPESWEPARTNVRSGGLKARRYVVAANIPYYITGEIIRQFLTADTQPRAMALLVQKEVAQRIVDSKGSMLSISVKAYGTPRIIAKVGKSHFSPPPSVDSAILLIDNISKAFFDDISEETFFDAVRAGFASKRKFVRSNLGSRFQVLGSREIFKMCNISEKSRAEDVQLDQWKCLVKHLAAET